MAPWAGGLVTVDGLELLTVVQREQPDVVGTDLTMPGLNDCWPTSPALRVVVLTMHEDDVQCSRRCANARTASS